MSIRPFAARLGTVLILICGADGDAAPAPNPGTEPAPGTNPAPGVAPAPGTNPTPGGQPGRGRPGSRPLAEPEPDPVLVEEPFEVSRVGKPNAKESREALLSIFEEIAKRHEVETAAKAGEMLANAETFRILERVDGPEEEGDNLCICERKGEFCIVSFPAGAFPRGETTPPMVAEQKGLSTYRVRVRRPAEDGAAGDGGDVLDVPSFFAALGVGEKPNLEIEVIPFPADNPPPPVGLGPVEVTKFGKTYHDYTADVALPKWVANLHSLVAESPELTRDQFLQDLRGGKTYKVTSEEIRKCPLCLGFGRISDDRPVGRAKDGKRLCTRCLGKKALLHKITYEVMWQR